MRKMVLTLAGILSVAAIMATTSWPTKNTVSMSNETKTEGVNQMPSCPRQNCDGKLAVTYNILSEMVKCYVCGGKGYRCLNSDCSKRERCGHCTGSGKVRQKVAAYKCNKCSYVRKK